MALCEGQWQLLALGLWHGLHRSTQGVRPPGSPFVCQAFACHPCLSFRSSATRVFPFPFAPLVLCRAVPGGTPCCTATLWPWPSTCRSSCRSCHAGQPPAQTCPCCHPSPRKPPSTGNWSTGHSSMRGEGRGYDDCAGRSCGLMPVTCTCAARPYLVMPSCDALAAVQ